MRCVALSKNTPDRPISFCSPARFHHFAREAAYPRLGRVLSAD